MARLPGRSPPFQLRDDLGVRRLVRRIEKPATAQGQLLYLGPPLRCWAFALAFL